jgi:hypothetical protein
VPNLKGPLVPPLAFGRIQRPTNGSELVWRVCFERLASIVVPQAVESSFVVHAATVVRADECSPRESFAAAAAAWSSSSRSTPEAVNGTHERL